MNRPDDIPEDVSATARASASTCRSAIFHLTEKSAGVWAQDGVIEAMNEAFARAILAERKRNELLLARWGIATGWSSDGSFSALIAAIRAGVEAR